MQICLATDAWSPQINGVVTTLSRTAATLTAWGHRVLLLTPERFRTVPCPTYPEIRLSLATTVAVSRLLADFAPDAVHIATEGPLGWTTRAACRRLQLDFTTSYHTRFREYLRLRLPVPLALSYAVVRRFHRPARRTMATAGIRLGRPGGGGKEPARLSRSGSAGREVGDRRRAGPGGTASGLP